MSTHTPIIPALTTPESANPSSAASSPANPENAQPTPAPLSGTSPLSEASSLSEALEEAELVGSPPRKAESPSPVGSTTSRPSRSSEQAKLDLGHSNGRKPISISTFANRKRSGRKITMLTAYDFLTAKLLDEAGVDSLLVGDSLGNVVQGRATTVPVTLDQMIYHGEMVARAAQHALVVVDLPFGTVQLGPHETLRAAIRVMKETGCAAVKLEVTAGQAPVIEAVASAGIPVMGHCGFRPQAVHQFGRQIVQRDAAVLADARAAQEAGAFAVVLECVGQEIANAVTSALSIPTIGIGAGNSCDGQVLVTPDLLGLTAEPGPKFLKRFADLRGQILSAVGQFCEEVRNGSFPDSEHSYK